MKLLPTKTIKVNEIDFVLSDEKAIAGDWALYGNTVTKKLIDADWTDDKKILCQLKSDSPIEGVPICDEVSVEELAEKLYPSTRKSEMSDITDDELKQDAFIEGYTLANKERGHSEEEMIKAIEYGNENNYPFLKGSCEAFFQSLPTKIFLLTDDEGKAILIDNKMKFVK